MIEAQPKVIGCRNLAKGTYLRTSFYDETTSTFVVDVMTLCFSLALESWPQQLAANRKKSTTG